MGSKNFKFNQWLTVLSVLILLIAYQNCSFGFNSQTDFGFSTDTPFDDVLTLDPHAPSSATNPVTPPSRVLSINTNPENLIGTNYRVGPEQDYENIGDVPWEELGEGDNVFIFHKLTPYYEKWVVNTSGSEDHPIKIIGVPSAEGELPVISGQNATTRISLSYWNENRGLLKLGGANNSDNTPEYIIIENLELRAARPPYSFIDDSGETVDYAMNAASFYIEKAAHITLRNCKIHDSGNGIFIGANDGATHDIMIEGNRIYDNGNVDSIYEHNNYSAAIDITFQFNYFGPLRSGTRGSNLKDRSAGLVVRYNWIEGGNRQLDLVDAEDSSVLVDHSHYQSTFVYGNVLYEPNDDGNSQMVHYGGDSGTFDDYRKGTLYFYNNTVVSARSGNTTFFRLSTNDEHADIRNNIFYVEQPANRQALLSEHGSINLSANYFKGSPQNSFSNFDGLITTNTEAPHIIYSTPGFVDYDQQLFQLSSDSLLRGEGLSLHSDVTSAGFSLGHQYLMHQYGEDRPNDDFLDLGAFEFE
ncbi:MAG: right-handed parallel beta-helix repeat-containing protein [Bdellovibrionaceae bacterium]|jgi:hypothetical protein|nr:right-handed parallel beta-helix repeat-containing protein [Pseudobdellovibrionaceae bacterium]